MKIEQLTFTRFIAALTVVFFHFGQNVFPLNTFPINNVLLAGTISVSYFFVLSGFIMMFVYYKPDQQKISKKKYWKARFARVFPIYMLALILSAIISFGKGNNDILALIANIFFLQAWLPSYALSFNSPGWTLSVEALFYLSFPFIIIYIHKLSLRKAIYIILAFWISTQLVHHFLLNTYYQGYPSTSHNVLFYNPLFHFSTFMIGVLGGLWFVKKGKNLTLSSHINTFIFFSSILLTVILLIYRNDIPTWLDTKIVFTNGLLAPLFLIAILTLAFDKGLIAKTLSTKTAILLGEASYSLYILQIPVHNIYHKFFITHFDWSEATHFYVFTLLLIIISILVFKLIEHPVRIFIRRF